MGRWSFEDIREARKGEMLSRERRGLYAHTIGVGASPPGHWWGVILIDSRECTTRAGIGDRDSVVILHICMHCVSPKIVRPIVILLSWTQTRLA